MDLVTWARRQGSRLCGNAVGSVPAGGGRIEPEGASSQTRPLSDRRSLALRGAEPEAAISALVGSLVSEHIGPGPKARTYLNGEVVTVVLTDTLTKGEERLVRDGMSELVLCTRRAFQQTMRQDLVVGIEEITGRRVRASASEMRPDITVEVLVLDAMGEGDMVRGARQPL